MTTIQLLAEWALRSSILIVSGSLLLRVLRVNDPSIRLAAWTAILCASLAVPALTVALPKLPLVVTWVSPALPVKVVTPGLVHDDSRKPVLAVTQPEIEEDRHAAGVSPRPDSPRAVGGSDVRVERGGAGVPKRFDLARAAVMVYVLVAFGLLLRLYIGLAMSLRLLRNSRVTHRGREGIEIRESDDVGSPVTLGIARPVVVLPVDWRQWSVTTLDAVLAHERSHIRRHDPAVQLLSAIHRALLWYSPLSWFLHRRIVRVAEEASDDAALGVVHDRALYAEMLLGFMQRGLRGASWHGVPVARYGHADKRIDRILDGTALSRGVTRRSVAVILALGLPFGYVVATAHPRSAPLAVMASLHPALTEIAKPSANQNSKIKVTSDYGPTPLVVAAAEGEAGAVKALLDKGADIEARDEYGATALLLAAHYSTAEVVKLLLDKGANVHAKDIYGSTALLLGAEQGSADVIKLLLDNGADIEDMNKYNSTPLLRAVYFGNTSAIKLLLDRHANLEAEDRGRRAALFVAVSQRNAEVVKLLLDKGAKPDPHNDGALLLLAAGNDMAEIVRLVVQKPVNTEVRNEQGFTPLMTEATYGDPEAVEALLERGANVEAKTYEGNTVLILAAEQNREKRAEVVKALVEKGAQIEVTDNDLFTPLMLEARWGDVDAVKLLLEKGANLEAETTDGRTALLLAAENGNLDTVRLLLDEGANIHATDHSGRTALTMAQERLNTAVAKLLRDRGAN